MNTDKPWKHLRKHEYKAWKHLRTQMKIKIKKMTMPFVYSLVIHPHPHPQTNTLGIYRCIYIQSSRAIVTWIYTAGADAAMR